jgi:predicted nucleic-acid-binding Zn-ribbon protein
MKASLCPRCDSETIVVDTINLSVGKAREVKATVQECPKCRLIFYEKASK